MKSIYVNVKLGGMKSIRVKGRQYDWNTSYETYNSRDQNELLRWIDLGIGEIKHLGLKEDREVDIRKQGNGNTRFTLSDSELIDALEEHFRNVYENVTETGSIQAITNKYGNIEIVIGDVWE